MLLMGVGFDATHRGVPDDRDINEEEEGEQRDVCCPHNSKVWLDNEENRYLKESKAKRLLKMQVKWKKDAYSNLTPENSAPQVS